MQKLTTKQFKQGLQQFETFSCNDFGAVRFSYAIAYYNYCNKYFVNFADHVKLKYEVESFNTSKEAYSFLNGLLKVNGLKSKC